MCAIHESRPSYSLAPLPILGAAEEVQEGEVASTPQPDLTPEEVKRRTELLERLYALCDQLELKKPSKHRVHLHNMHVELKKQNFKLKKVQLLAT